MKRPIWILALALALSAYAGDDAESLRDYFETLSSPDGRYSLHASFDEDKIKGIEVVEKSSKRELVDLSDCVISSEPRSLNLVWSKDSKSFAVNFHADGSKDETRLYRLKAGTFYELVAPEKMLFDRVVEPARQRELQAAGKTGDTYLRHIWDTWETVKWTDASTVEIHGECAASYYEDNNPVDITVGVEATVRFDSNGKADLLRAKEVPAKD